MKKALILLLALVMLFSIVACSGGGTPGDVTPGGVTPGGVTPGGGTPGGGEAPVLPELPPEDITSRIVDSISYSPRDAGWDVSPWKNAGNAGNSIWQQLYSCLMANPRFGTKVEDMHYDMAESVTFSADRMTATVKLRDYIHDSKGNPIKAEDVVFSYQTAPTVNATYARVNNFLTSITAIDPLTIEMKINTTVPGTWEPMLAYVPIVSKSWYESASDEEKATDPATTGAYRVIEHITGVRTVLEAVENFWQKDELRSMYQAANAKRLNYIGFQETSMRIIALENGELDAIFIEATLVDRFKNDPNFVVKDIWTTNPATLVFNGSENSPFYNNLALRLAVIYAVDWDQAGVSVGGTGSARGRDVAPMVCSNYDSAWNDQPYYEFNPDLAKQYLAEAGYPNGGLTLRLHTRNDATLQSAGTVIQSYLKDIGIDLIVLAPDPALFVTNQTVPTEWDLWWAQQTMSTGFVTESWAYYYAQRGDGGNASFVKDGTMQALLDTAMEKNDAASLKAFHDYALEQAYALNILNERCYWAMRPEILEFPVSFLTTSAINACVFSDDY